MTETIYTPHCDVTITFDPDDGFITDAPDWDAVHAADAAGWATIASRSCFDGASTYSTEYYFTGANREGSA